MINTVVSLIVFVEPVAVIIFQVGLNKLVKWKLVGWNVLLRTGRDRRSNGDSQGNHGEISRKFDG